MHNVDVVIVGGGMVGLAVACGLQGSGLRVAVLEHQLPTPLGDGDPATLRVSAINAASERLLTHLGVWSTIVRRASCYHGMAVWDKDSFGQITFDGSSIGATHLGYIIENRVIHQALWDKAQQMSDVICLAPAVVKQVAFGENDVFITLEEGDLLSARLVIGADGAHSWLRREANIALTFWDYGHHALVATVKTEQPHHGIARQMFHGDGILAFLPLSNPDQCSIVWSLPPEKAAAMRDCPAMAFNQALATAFDLRLGLCEVVSERQCTPLMGRYAYQFASQRLALVGDAAHTVHPLAGQGVNLGFMDAAALIAELRRLHQQGRDIGQHLYLRRYERSRKHSAALMLSSMQGFRDLFAGSHPAKKLFRGIGLKLADTLPGLKTSLIRQALGLHDLPEWLR